MIFKEMFENDEVEVRGYGKVNPEMTKKLLSKQFRDIADRIESADDARELKNVYYILYKTGVIDNKLLALIDYENNKEI